MRQFGEACLTMYSSSLQGKPNCSSYLLQYEIDFDVDGGEFFGFYWRNYGVVSYKWADRDDDDDSFNQNYCGGNAVPSENSVIDLDLSGADDKDSRSHRDYAIWWHWCGKVPFGSCLSYRELLLVQVIMLVRLPIE